MQQDGTLGKMYLVKPLRVDDLINKHQVCVWYQYDISLADHSLVGTFQFGKTGQNK